MDKLKRLRWIPMLVKAYSDARAQQELNRQQLTLPSAVLPRSTDAPSAPQKHIKRTPRPYRMQVRPQQLQRRARPNMTTKQPTQAMRSVLKELRATRRQISRLESLQQQLTELQSQIDSQMGQLFERLEEKKVQSKPVTMMRNTPLQ